MFRLLCCLLPGTLLVAQVAPTVGLRENTPRVHAFTNARIIVSPGVVQSNATLVIRDGTIAAVGERVSVPPEARIWDCTGLTLYPGFIDLSTDYGMAKSGASGQGPGSFSSPSTTSPNGALHWNAKTLAHVRGEMEFKPDEKAAERLRSQGFVAVLTRPTQGIFRGSSAFVALVDAPARTAVIRLSVAQHVSLSQTGSFVSGYPNSLMGTIALVRQTWIDASWYGSAWDMYSKNPQTVPRPETNAALAALQDAIQSRQPVVIDASDELNLLRAAKIMREFKLTGWINGSGKEFRRLDAVKAAKLPIVVPVNYPETPGVQTPEEGLNVTVEDLREWDIAPENPARLVRSGVTVALTTEQLKDAGTFLANVRKAVRRGLSPDAALAALTSTPAKLAGVDKRFGSLESGKSASFVLVEGDLWQDGGTVRDVWVEGTRHEVKALPGPDLRGTWSMTVSLDLESTGTLTLKGDWDKPAGTILWRQKELALSNVTYGNGRIAFNVPGDSLNLPGSMRMSGVGTSKDLSGIGERGDGVGFSWTATRTGPMQVQKDSSGEQKTDRVPMPDVFPFGEFGRPALPPQPGSLLIRNATVWTMGNQGKLEGSDVLVSSGKIASVGKNLKAPAGAQVIDGTGKHVTPGLIDSHSHQAISGSVNEGGQAITCEVRIADVIDPDDIWIYRQLAGGTTAANILHGSANPIGGQNAVLKWRWGALPDEMILSGAPEGVKFALGENVKRSHSTQPGTEPRYPRTRMGVEEIIRDRFQAAHEYDRSWKEWQKNKKGLLPRRDLELEAIVEMLNGTRLIHAHSYRQDEILMLLRVAEEFGIRIATLQHILEGYKVADVIAKHGAGGAGFSDWWAYKWEAYEAIPGNLPLMHKQGVLISYNSDNAQLATRLNWEAAKGLDYGLSEEEALAAVTINPAKQLGVDRWVGSLESGKDADIAVWNGNPLSTGSRCVQTWVDGRRYFDAEDDLDLQKIAAQEKAALIQRVLKEGKSQPGASTTSRMRRPGEYFLKTCMDGAAAEGYDHE